MARSGMATLITDLRGMIFAGSADYTVNGVAYWTDDQLQAELDRTQIIRNFQFMTPHELVASGGSAQYFDYELSPGRWFEQTTGGTAIFVVRDGVGSIIAAANYSVNYNAGVVTFTANTLGSAYYADYRYYDLYNAAANIWRWKAASVTNKVDWKSDNMQRSASQEQKACLSMADYYTRMTGSQSRSVQIKTWAL